MTHKRRIADTDLLPCILVFLVALTFQFGVSHLLSLTTDPLKYEYFARNYLEGSLDKERLIDGSPLYFYFHVAVARLPHSGTLVHVIQGILQALSAVLLFLLARLHFSRRLAFACAVAFITSRSVFIYTNLAEPEPFMVFFLLAYLLFAHRQTVKSAFVAGIFLSCSLLTRSNFLPLVLVTPLHFLLTTGTAGIGRRQVVAFCAPILLAVAFLVGRNSMITGAVTPFSMNPGYVFFEGNNPNSNGDSAIYPPTLYGMIGDIGDKSPDNAHVVYREFARRATGERLTIPQVNAYWTGKARNFMQDHPWHALKNWLFKLYASFNGYRKHDLPVAYNHDLILQKASVPTLPFALIAALALVGAAVSLGSWKKYLLLYGALGSQLLIMTLTYVSDRQRAVIVGLFILFAALAADRMHRRGKGALPCLLATVILTAGFWYLPPLLADHRHSWQRSQAMAGMRSTAINARTEGRLAAAGDDNARCLALTPEWPEKSRLAGLSHQPSFEEAALRQAGRMRDTGPSARFDLAVLLLEAGHLDDAEKIFRELPGDRIVFNRQYRQSSLPHYYLARICELRQRHGEAADWLRRGLALNPGDPWILSHLAVLTGEKRYGDLIVRYFGEIDAAYFLGRAYRALGQYDKAIGSFESLLGKLPEFRNGRVHLALALAGAGRYAEAARHYIVATTPQPEFIFAEQEVLHMFREWVRSAGTPEARYRLGVVLQDFGHYRESLALQQEALQEGLPDGLARECAGRIEWLKRVALRTAAPAP